jgi:hypothetical protein
MKQFERPSLFTMTGRMLTPDDDVSVLSTFGNNDCSSGSGNDNTCKNGSSEFDNDEDPDLE